MQPEHCNYYGRLGGKLPKYRLGEFILDESYMRILDKHESSLINRQEQIILKLKKTFTDELKMLKEIKSSIVNISDRLKVIEKSMSIKKNKERSS